MSETPTMTTAKENLIPGICVALLSLMVFLMGWRVSSHISAQNDDLNIRLTAAKQQRDGQMQSLMNFRNALLQYVQQTRDGNVLMLMNRYGLVQVQQQPAAGTPAVTPAEAPAPAATALPQAQPIR